MTVYISFAVLWALIGIGLWCYMIWIDGHLSVGDLLALPLFILGGISMLLIFASSVLMDRFNHTLWVGTPRRKVRR